MHMHIAGHSQISAAKRIMLGCGFAMCVIALVAPVWADAGEPGDVENVKIEFAPMPLRYLFVDGDAERFQMHHWVKENYSGGVKELTADYKVNDIEIALDAHALMDSRDYEAELLIKKPKLWYVDFHFEQFRKYFDDSGGTYHLFTLSNFKSPEFEKELGLDIGHVSIEAGLTWKDLPEFIFFYEHHYKNGTKSRLTWGEVEANGVTRNIYPTFQEVDESVDTIKFSVNDEIKGFKVSAEQTIEYFGAETMRQEEDISDTSTSGDKKIRRQTLNPRSVGLTSILDAERWFLDDRMFFSSGYRFGVLDGREFETIQEINPATGLLFNFDFPEQVVNARARTKYDSHTWVAHLLGIPAESLTVDTKIRAEISQQHGSSVYPQETAAGTPNFSIDRTEVSDVENHTRNFGESFGLRYTGIPRTTLYSELELEQRHINLRQHRDSLAGEQSASSTERYDRNTISKLQKSVITFGTRIAPWWFMDWTSHVRHRSVYADHDNQLKTVAAGDSTALTNEQEVQTGEFMTRIKIKPLRTLWTSFRYQYKGDDYSTRFDNQPVVETDMLSHIYTFDVVMQPLADLLLTTSFSKQTANVHTPATFGSAALPGFNADVNTWLLSMDYTFNPELSLHTELLYSRADNFNDFASAGLPLGVDDRRVDVLARLEWAVRENLTIEPQYAYYQYQANTNADASGDYNAHLLLLEATLTWG